MKTIGIYDPYIHILGGAERYILSIARCLNKEYRILLFAKDPHVVDAAQKKFGLDISNVTTIPWPENRSMRAKILNQLAYFFYVTDGSLFFSPADCDILIIQSPAHIPPKTIPNWFKLKSFKIIICYSEFVQKIITKKLNRISSPLFVPVDKPVSFKVKKERIILSVGRFFSHLHNKKQYEMVELFKKMLTEGLAKTTLYLVGSVDPGEEAYLEKVVQSASGFPVKILTDVSYSELQKLYARAKIYWHSAGWGEDLELYPERAEHFGVSTIEAMSYGAVPVVYAAGGQIEIVHHEQDGYLWKTAEECKTVTHKLLSELQTFTTMSKAAQKTATQYSSEAFCKKLHEIIEK